MGLEKGIDVVAKHMFKDGEYLLSMSIGDDKILRIQAEKVSTGEQWVGKFNPNYIEQLTHKTGNFKEFSIFCSMLELGFNKASDSIKLELMGYSDLESLRSQKSGLNDKKMSNGKVHSRRYLIMTYTVEFDRIHYPLSLNHVGKTDLVSLKKVVDQQKHQIKELTSKLQAAAGSPKKKSHQSSSFQRLKLENEALISEVQTCQQALSNDATKEIRMLKKVIQELESNLLKEKNRNRRIVQKKANENRYLAKELEKSRSMQRNLRVRVKNLNSEVAILKRCGRVLPSAQLYADRWLKGAKTSLKQWQRSPSFERMLKSPSPDRKRFDPTAYIKMKKKKQQEVLESKSRQMSSRSRSVSFERYSPVRSTRGRDRSSKQKPHITFARDTVSRGRTFSGASSGSRPSSVGSLASSVGSRQSSAGSRPSSVGSGSHRMCSKSSTNRASYLGRGTSGIRSPGSRPSSGGSGSGRAISKLPIKKRGGHLSSGTSGTRMHGSRPSSVGSGSERAPSKLPIKRGSNLSRGTSGTRSAGSRPSSVGSGSERVFSKSSAKRTSHVGRGKSGARSLPKRGSKKTLNHSVFSSGESEMITEGANSRKKKHLVEGDKPKELRREDDKSPYNYIDAKIDFEPSMDIAEIDARLNALQKFMKSNMKDL